MSQEDKIYGKIEAIRAILGNIEEDLRKEFPHYQGSKMWSYIDDFKEECRGFKVCLGKEFVKLRKTG